MNLAKQDISIGYDATASAGPRTGIGEVTGQLLTAIAQNLPPGWRVRAWVNRPRHPLPTADEWTSSPKVKLYESRLPGRLLLYGWRRFCLPYAELFVGPVNIFHSPSGYCIPTRSAKSIVTVHDLHFLDAHGSRDPRGGGYMQTTYPKALVKADRIIAVSQYTKNALLKAYNLDESKVIVIYNGIDHIIYHAKPMPEDVGVPARYIGEDKPFFFFLGSFSPRKNLSGLLCSYAEALTHRPSLPMLVIAGHPGEDHVRKDFEQRVETLGIGRQVKCLGYLATSEIASLYRRATAFVMPSLSEGFGLPAAEAMACGCPVIASRNSGLLEVTGEVAELIDPNCNTSLAQAMLKLWLNPTYRRTASANGPKQAMRFTWDAAAKATIALYQKILDEASCPA